jgi:hypothetical protein
MVSLSQGQFNPKSNADQPTWSMIRIVAQHMRLRTSYQLLSWRKLETFVLGDRLADLKYRMNM